MLHETLCRTSMSDAQRNQILCEAAAWFKRVIAQNHIRNTEKLSDARNFCINPFLVGYLANFLTGNSDAESIARALVYPRVLGSSITTSFGQNFQTFIPTLRGILANEAEGSVASGVDIEYINKNGMRVFCQMKAGPNTINKDDVETIDGHFRSLRLLARTNGRRMERGSMVVGVLYGTREELSPHYRRLQEVHDYPVLVGQEFWYDLTRDPYFYDRLIAAIAEVSHEMDSARLLEDTIKKLANSKDVTALATD